MGLFLGLHALNLNAQNSQGDNFVYVMSNKNPGNSVIQFRRASNGALTWVREVATGGNGSGANGADPLGSQDSLVLGGGGLRLVAVNAGSNEVSVFGSIAGRLIWLSKSPSGGVFPNSVALSGDLVYVLNKNGTTPISLASAWTQVEPSTGQREALAQTISDLAPTAHGCCSDKPQRNR